MVEDGALYFTRTDHIGRPIFATDNSGTKVWEASYLPFGGVQTSTGANSTLRFPGQWFQSETALHQNWMRDYDPTLGRYIQADPLGLVDGASVYGYGLQNPGRYMDIMGLEVFVYSSDAFGISGLNHTFVYSTETNSGIGSNGSSIVGTLGDGVTDLTSLRVRVDLPAGMSEREFMDRIVSAPTWNNGLYFPFLNDCHYDLERAFDHARVPYPGAPNRRFDADDNARSFLGRFHSGINRHIRNSAGQRNY